MLVIRLHNKTDMQEYLLTS